MVCTILHDVLQMEKNIISSHTELQDHTMTIKVKLNSEYKTVIANSMY